MNIRLGIELSIGTKGSGTVNMFGGFNPSLLDTPDFKEDSVREVIILPMLTRLGYSPSGDVRVIRSKTLQHPFIYVGTGRHPVRLIPDYTLLSGDKPILILDAKSPTEDILSRANVQQAYSYAIHPEVKSQHFALCNGKSLAVFSVDDAAPLLVLPFAQYEAQWEQIESHLAPRFLLEPILRRFAPDFGSALLRLGLAPSATITMFDVHLNTFGRVDTDLVTVSCNCDFADKPHMISFDFHPKLLPDILAGLPPILAERFTEAFNRSPFMACADLMVVVDLNATLGPATDGASETFIPLVITDIMAARFDPTPGAKEPKDIPDTIFRLSKAFTLRRPPD